MTMEATTAAPFPTRSEYDEAVETARNAAATYYHTDTLVMSDVEYDELVARIEATETAHPDWEASGITEVAGGTTSGGDVPHSTPMLSLDKAHDTTSIENWYHRTLTALHGTTDGEVGFTVEPKLDGVAVAVRYENGNITKVITRGDGRTGENITDQIVDGGTIGLPEVLPWPATIEVRGEVYMNDEQFIDANETRTAYGKAPFVNARNGVAGTVRDIGRDYAMPKTFAAYSLHNLDVNSGFGFEGHTESDILSSHALQMALLRRMKFVPALGLIDTPTEPVDTLDAILAVVDHMGGHRAAGTLGFEIDGAVIKVDNLGCRDELGATGSHPRWALAFKYPAEERTTTVLDIDMRPGRTGILVPRAILDPVFVGGVTVTYATLHNPEMAADILDIHIGDTVLVKRAGDVIPRVEGVLLEKRPADAKKWMPPTECPRCGSDVDRSNKRWKCVRGRLCGVNETLEYYASRDAMDIEGLGAGAVEALVSGGLVNDPADLYNLTVSDVQNLDGFAKGSATNLVENIQASKTQPLHRLFTALGVGGTGRSLSRKISRHFGTLDAIRNATVTEFAEVEKIGTKKAAMIVAELEEISDLIDRLVDYGLNTVDEFYAAENETDASDLPFTGMKIVVTGSVPGMTRTSAQENIERLGGTASSSVSKATTLLIVGEGAGASKAAKAESLGIRIMTAEEYAEIAKAHGLI